MSCNLIKRLPSSITEAVRSTAQAADLPSAACELVLNSIQAGARSIKVTASIDSWSVSVDDDGCGISAASMPLLGQRCCTSKQDPCRGEALASLAELSEHITITSRAANSFETHKKQLVAGDKAAPAHAPHSTASSTSLCPISRQRQGTTVNLVGFLHNQPVRRRRLLQQHAGPSTSGAGTLAASTAAATAAAASAAARSSSSAMQELKLALFELVLPYTGVELVLQEAGSSSAVLHLPQVGWCLLLDHALHVQPHWF